MKLLIFRHAESQKNISKAFSSAGNNEELTAMGIEQANRFGQSISDYALRNNLSVKNVYVADSMRAKSTGRPIADALGVDLVCVKDFISSTSDKAIMGKTEQEVEVINPQFSLELKLFRAGLFSSYDFTTVPDGKNKMSFEKRVGDAFDKIIDVSDEDLKIIVMHHSSITALLIRLARIAGHYPENHYGCVASDFGKIYLLDYQNDIEAKSIPNCKFILVNESVEKLSNIKL